jgi:pseudaminic acid synthase
MLVTSRKTPVKEVKINGRAIGPRHPPYVVAEMSGNHNHDLSRALKIVEAARAAGADAIKLQTYRASTITIESDREEFVVRGGLWDGQRLYDLYEEAHTPWEWHLPIFEYARELGLTVFSSPFDPTAVDFLEDLGVPAYKIASPELVDLPLIRKIARLGKPMILSTGAATFEEIGEAVEAARAEGCDELIVLHCTAAYPAPPEEANLSTLQYLAREFNVVVGLSDHTLGTHVSTLAVGLGASFIEKHFTLARADGGVDSAFSIEPQELAELVQTSKSAQLVLGSPSFSPTKSESNVLRNRRSLYVVKRISKGDLFNTDNVRSIRPANGLKPKYLDRVLGKAATRDIDYGEPLDFSMIGE